eukprot:1888738-Rhodomonas_salina.2
MLHTLASSLFSASHRLVASSLSPPRSPPPASSPLRFPPAAPAPAPAPAAPAPPPSSALRSARRRSLSSSPMRLPSFAASASSFRRASCASLAFGCVRVRQYRASRSTTP